MLEQELQWERNLFFFLNGSDSPLWDSFFYFYSYKWTWIPLYLCFLFVFIYRKRGMEIKNDWKEIVWTIVALILVVTLCDQIASGIFKPLFQRFRPTHHPDFQELVKTVYGMREGKYGFASSHAANIFGLATFTALLFRNQLFTFTLFSFALITGYSRIYLGVHFISDVVVGALIGILVGYVVYRIYRWKVREIIYPKWKVYLLCFVYIVTVVVLFIIHYLNQNFHHY